MKKLSIFIILLSVSLVCIYIVFVSKNNVEQIPEEKSKIQLSVKTSWQIQLQGIFGKDRDSNLYIVDLFDVSTTTVHSLKSRGKVVICYFSAGTGEDWRTDYWKFKEKDMGKKLTDWPGERWLDTKSLHVREIMVSRLDIAKDKGCDGVDPDNIDAYSNDNGILLTADTQIKYNIFLSEEAHKRGLLIGLKNDVSQIKYLVSYFDFATNEQCFKFSECEGYSIFTSHNKPVFDIEYDTVYSNNIHGRRDDLCRLADTMNIRTIISSKELDGRFIYSCD